MIQPAGGLQMIQYYPLARKIHRLCVLGMVVFGLIMGTTGSLMKYAQFVVVAMPSVDLLLARKIHNTMSPFFAIIFGIMMVSGGYMYLYPWFLKRSQKKKENLPRS